VEFAEALQLADPYVWIGTGIILAVFGILMFERSLKQKEIKMKQSFYKGIALFYLLYGISKFFHYYGEVIMGFNHPSYPIIWKFGTVPTFIAFTSLIYVVEKFTVKTKYIFTISTIIVDICTLFFPYDYALYVSYFGSPFAAFYLLGIYIYLGFKVPGIRKASFFKFIALLIYFVGFGLNIKVLQEMVGFKIRVIGNILLIIGGYLYILQNLKDKAEDERK